MATLIGKVYRGKIAAGAHAGINLPAVTQVALGTGTTPWSADDIALENEIAGTRKNIDSATLNNLTVTVVATVLGSEIGDAIVSEIAYYDSEGGFVAREVLKPKQFESETSIRIESHLQF